MTYIFLGMAEPELLVIIPAHCDTAFMVGWWRCFAIWPTLTRSPSLSLAFKVVPGGFPWDED